MRLLKTPKEKSLFALALFSAATSVLFSFFGAPFLRTFSVSSRSRVFWLTASLLICILLVLGLQDYKISETAVYVGAIWMTLGSYSELEKRGVNWKSASLVSLSAGFLFALAGYFLVLKNLITTESIAEMVKPLQETINSSFPDAKIEAQSLLAYVPGAFAASLVGALALGFVFETKVSKMFRIKRERIASGLRWLEFRLPDTIVWVTLFAALFSLDYAFLTFDGTLVKVIARNWLIFAAVVFFLQGITVTEFMVRFFRLGTFTRTAIYLLIVLQMAPFIVFVGFVDYWADFRRLVRRKTKII